MSLGLGLKLGLRPSGGQAVPAIIISANTIAEDASVGDAVGTLSVINATGTPAFTLDDDAGGLFALDGAVVEVAGALDYETASSHQITVSVSGVTPSIAPRVISIQVLDVSEGGGPSLDFSNPANSQFIGQVV